MTYLLTNLKFEKVITFVNQNLVCIPVEQIKILILGFEIFEKSPFQAKDIVL